MGIFSDIQNRILYQLWKELSGPGAPNTVSKQKILLELGQSYSEKFVLEALKELVESGLIEPIDILLDEVTINREGIKKIEWRVNQEDLDIYKYNESKKNNSNFFESHELIENIIKYEDWILGTLLEKYYALGGANMYELENLIGENINKELIRIVVKELENLGLAQFEESEDEETETGFRGRITEFGVYLHEHVDISKSIGDAPASDRLVKLDHNLPDYKEAVSSLDKFIQDYRDDHQLDNEFGLEKTALITTLVAGRELFDATQVQVSVAVALTIEPLKIIAKKYDEAAVGGTIAALATTVINLLLKILGLG